MKSLKLTFGLFVLAAATHAQAQQAIEFRYDPAKQPRKGGTFVPAWSGWNIVYYGHAMPMKLCAKNGSVILSIFTPRTKPASFYHVVLQAGECRFATPTRIALQSGSTGVLATTVIPNVQMVQTPPSE